MSALLLVTLVPAACGGSGTSALSKNEIRTALQRAGLTDIARRDVQAPERRFAVSGFTPRGNEILVEYFPSTVDARQFGARNIVPGENAMRVCNIWLGFNVRDAYVRSVVTLLQNQCGHI